jgi:hypothetical protein
MANPMFDAAQEALGDVLKNVESFGPPPGAQPIPLKDQLAQFVADAPDVFAKGPRYQEIESKHGTGAAEEYKQAMLTALFGGRQRRRPM